MTKAIGLYGLLFLVGCGGDAKPAPSCFEAFAHYYAAGCTLVDLSTGQPASQSTVTGQCQQSAASLPANCQGELDVYLGCVDESTPAKQCDCSQEQMALIRCH